MRKTTKFGVALALAVMCVMLVYLAATPIVFAEEQTATNEASIQNFVQTLCQYNGAGDKEGARSFIVQSFKAVLGEDDGVAASDSKVVEQRFATNSKNYCNIEARLEVEGATKQIIIGAHYDTTEGEGAGDNACGVAALYQIFKTLYERRDELTFNVVFVAFDGEEDGLIGSYHYVNGYVNVASDGMSQEEIDNTLVMFNVDSIALGTRLYLMCENKRTDLADLVLYGWDPNEIREKPYAIGTQLEYDVSFGYGYYEFVQGSDHTPFRLAGIPTALFFSGMYRLGSWNFDSGDAINSLGDTYENLKKHTYVERILTVTYVITEAVLDKNFVSAAENTRSQLVNLSLTYNAWWPTIVVAVILVGLVVATVLYNRKLQKKAILGTAEVKTEKVFDKPSAEDIFTFKDDDDKQNNGDIEDIFTFKK